MIQPNYLKLAKQGDTEAIGVLINRSLQPKGINAKIAFKNSCLKIMLESTSAPDQQVLVEFIRKGITNLDIKSVKIVQVYGRLTGEDFPEWSQEFTLVDKLAPSLNSSKTNLINYPIKQQSKDKSSKDYQSNSGKKQNDQKEIILSTLWNFYKWYISGFRGKSYESIHVSSQFLRICHRYLRIFLTAIFLILGSIILSFMAQNNSISSSSNSSISSSSRSTSGSSSVSGNVNSISSSSNSPISSSSESTSGSSSISGKVNGKLCARNFNDSMGGVAEATFDSSNKTINILISDSGRTLNEQEFQQISTKMASGTFSTCYIKTVKVESSGYSTVIQNP